MKWFFSLILMLFASSVLTMPERDWHTQSNYQQVVSTHVHLDLNVDFASRQLQGFIEHHIQRIDTNASHLLLDTRDLTILKITQLAQDKWLPAPFKLAPNDPVRGRLLSIKLLKNTNKVRVYYHSNPNASGLQWLTPEQTAGKKMPFMFTQSQAIHARSWMPIQDTPAMRVTYSAEIKTDPRLRPVMSAINNPKRSDDGIYQFNMPQAIPPYLIAIAVGDLHYQKMSKQTAIYAEKPYLAIAAKEFEDTQAMIDVAESLYGPYLWAQYDLLILPPSFPFGGMENPRLSFITPTVLAGDKSLVSLIAHELAHSWSGNLVTNATWRDLWLNEGFTTYVENRIMEKVFGEKRAQMEQVLGVQSLQNELKDLPISDQILHLQLENRDPDDAFSEIPYVKGQQFLVFLEQRFGREKFDDFIKQYFAEHAFQSLSTEQFIRYLEKNLLSKYPGLVSPAEVSEWIFQPGMPDFTVYPQSDAFEKVQVQIDNWIQDRLSLGDIKSDDWSVHEWLFFINHLPQDLSIEQMTLLDKQFQFTQSRNNEIAHAWLLLSIKHEYTAANQRLENYLINIGRRKLITPLYTAMLKNKNYREFARSVYIKARPGYHPMAQSVYDEMFGVENTKNNR